MDKLYAEDFIVTHLKTIENPHKVYNKLFIILEECGLYSIIYNDEPDKKWKTSFNSADYNAVGVGKFVIFSGIKGNKAYIWNQRVLLEERKGINIIKTKKNTAIAEDIHRNKRWFIRLDSDKSYEIDSHSHKELFLFSEDTYLFYKLLGKVIVFYFCEYNVTKVLKYSSDNNIKAVTSIDMNGLLFFSLGYHNMDYDIIQVLPDYTVKNHKKLRYLKYEYYDVDLEKRIVSYNGKEITKFDSKDYIDIDEEFCVYTCRCNFHTDSSTNVISDTNVGAVSNPDSSTNMNVGKVHTIVRKCDNDIVVKLCNNILYNMSSNGTFTTRKIRENTYDIYRFGYESYFTSTDKFRYLNSSKKKIIYNLFLIYKYSDLRKLPSEVLFYLFGFI